MNSFKKLALGATLAAACLAGAQAAEVDSTFLLSNMYENTVGTLAQYYSVSDAGVTLAAQDTFVDDYYLTLAEADTFTLALKSLAGAVTFSSVTMYDNFADVFPFTTSTALPSTGFYGTGLSLDSGFYVLEITGTANADGAGYGGALFNAAAVPEPQEWALLVAGLGVLGLYARRRAARG